MLVIAGLCFLLLGLNNIVVVSTMVNIIRLWHPLMYRDLYDIWFVGSSEMIITV